MKSKLIKVLGAAASITPISVVVGLNYERYFTTSVKTVSMSFALGIILIVVLLQSFGAIKRRYGGSCTTLAIICILSYVLQPILMDVCMLSGMLLCGQLANKAVFIPIANVVASKEKLKREPILKRKLQKQLGE